MPIIIKKKIGVAAAPVVADNDQHPVETEGLSSDQRSRLIRALARQLAWQDHVKSMTCQEGKV